MKLKEFAEIVQGTIIGDPETDIIGVSPAKESKKGDITFIASQKHIKDLQDSDPSCVIVKEPIEGLSATQLQVPNPYYVFARAIECFHPRPSFEPGVSSRASVSGSAVISDTATIFPFACISDDARIGDETVIMSGVFIGEGTTIGKQCVIHSNVVIREGVTIGDRVIIHSGTVIGSDGYGYVLEDGSHYKIPQVGGVIIEDEVEIGSNASIDRATLGNTFIGKGAKIDNLVQIAHNVKIGEGSLIVAQVAIGGSAELGNFVTLAGQVGLADHATVETGTIFTAKSGAAGHIAKGVYSGIPAIPHANWLRAQALYSRLPEMQKRIRTLEEKLNKLEKGESR
jgi:UDP-3-O-[3-hydroxymyristoyl] glucosamine N-acyltransferase